MHFLYHNIPLHSCNKISLKYQWIEIFINLLDTFNTAFGESYTVIAGQKALRPMCPLSRNVLQESKVDSKWFKTSQKVFIANGFEYFSKDMNLWILVVYSNLYLIRTSLSPNSHVTHLKILYTKDLWVNPSRKGIPCIYFVSLKCSNWLLNTGISIFH